MRRNDFFRKRKLSSMIKEALDNLPSGICYFDDRGVPVLINKTMYELMHTLTHRDIQDISDFDECLKSASKIPPLILTSVSCETDLLKCPLPRAELQSSNVETFSGCNFKEIEFSQAVASDGKEYWQFNKKSIGNSYTEIIASNITELHQKRCELEKSTVEQQNLMNRLEEISRNVVSITRNEEILAMKMRIHSELGIALAETRQFINSDFATERKAEYIENHRKVAKKLLGEIGNDDEIDVFSELETNAEKLGTKIILDGELPESIEGLMTQIIRECLINTIKHGKGDKVFVKTNCDEKTFTAVITGNGDAPSAKIIEGGGLSSIRKIETIGGTMQIECNPNVVIRIALSLNLLPHGFAPANADRFKILNLKKLR